MRWTLVVMFFAFASTLAAAEGAIGVIFMDDPSPGVLAHFGGVGAGAVVTDTIPGGPAAKAGLRLGDVVIAVNGKPVADFDALRKLATSLVPGTKAEITYRRRKDHADGHDETTVRVDVVDRETFRELDEPQPQEKP